MTAICPGGGPSQIIPGTQELQNMLAGAITDFLVAEEMDWAAPLASGLGYLAFDLLNLCATDPPALPSIDAARIAGYFNPLNPQGAAQLRQDMTDLIGHYLWFQYCECVTGPQPPPTAPVPQPPGYQTDNPQVTGPPAATECYVEDNRGTTITWDTSNNFLDDFAQNYYPPNWQGVTWITLSADTDQPGDFPVTFTFEWRAAQGDPILGTTTFTLQQQAIPLTQPQQTVIPPPGTGGFSWRGHRTGTPQATSQVSAIIHKYCGPPPSQVLQPCCPPDPTLENLISQVLRLEYQILSMFGGGKLPFVDSTVHANLSGTGAVSISPAAAAIRIDIVNRPTPWPDNPGTPDFLFSIGFITPFAVGTPLRGSRLVYDHQTFQYPSYTDQIGYTLPGGVTVNLVELVTASA